MSLPERRNLTVDILKGF